MEEEERKSSGETGKLVQSSYPQPEQGSPESIITCFGAKMESTEVRLFSDTGKPVLGKLKNEQRRGK